MATNNERQMWTVQHLEHVRDDCTLESFETEEMGDAIYVRRVYSPNHARVLKYVGVYLIGPRGGRKTLHEYSTY